MSRIPGRRALLGWAAFAVALAIGVFLVFPVAPTVFAVAVPVVTGRAHFYVAPSASMAPTLCPGDNFVTESYGSGNPKPNDIIVFHPPLPGLTSEIFDKRVVGVGGDTITFRDGLLHVNGRVFDHDPVAFGGARSHTVAPGSYYVLGDNRNVSEDSRVFGDVPRSAITGKVIAILWPWSRVRRIRGGAPNALTAASC